MKHPGPVENPWENRPDEHAKMLLAYQENHQIQPFMQGMLGEVFTVMPEDPYEYMTYHIAANKPAPPPPQDDTICGSGALWVLLPGRDAMGPENWKLRRCWVTDKGDFCISNNSATVSQTEGGGLSISAPSQAPPQSYSVEVGPSFRELDEDEVGRPFAFSLAAGPGPLAQRNAQLGAGRWWLFLAACSEEQRDAWCRLVAHFADQFKRQGPAPKPEPQLCPRLAAQSSAALLQSREREKQQEERSRAERRCRSEAGSKGSSVKSLNAIEASSARFPNPNDGVGQF
mmetsp:Transcript_26358/g.46675  ORF Transcript_26358/g.46675 Transcript_26358/m.46675 type:complete len:286 (+) Transcript_26358:810-1667(+)